MNKRRLNRFRNSTMKISIHKGISHVCRFALFLFSTWLPLISFGQSVDSLEQVLATKTLTDEEKIVLYQDLSKRYTNLNTQKSLDFAKTGLSLAVQTENKKMEAMFCQNLSSTYILRSVYDSASFYLDKALPIALKLKDATLEAALYRLHGSLYVYQDKYDLAMDYYKKSATIFENMDDAYELCQTYSGIGTV